MEGLQAIIDLQTFADDEQAALIMSEIIDGINDWQQAVHSLKQQVSSLRVQLDDKQRAVDTLAGQVDTLTGHLHRGQGEVSRWEQQARSGQGEVSTLHKRLTAARAEAEGARAQLSVKQREVDALRTALDAEQQQVSRLRVHLQAEQERLFALSQRLDSGQAQQATKQGSSRPASSVQSNVDSGQVDTNGQVISLDASRVRRKSEQDEGGESAILEQVRELLRQQPGLSARGIAKQLACSPTTAAKWKEVVEREQQQQHNESLTECVNH